MTELAPTARADLGLWTLRARVRALALDRPWLLLVCSAMLVWSGVVFALLWSDYSNFLYLRFDLGNMTQAVWSTAHGRPLEMTSATGEQVSRLSFHVDPILALLAPLWLVLPSPLTLAGVQVVGSALAALPVYWLGRRHLESDGAAALLALTFLAYPWLAWNALDAMHPVTLAIPLLLFGIWFLDTGRVGAFAACAVLAVLCGELVGLVVAGIGLWYWLARQRRRAVLAIAAGGLAWSVVAVKVIIPYFADGPSVYYAHFAEVGGSPEGVLRALLTDPASVLTAAGSARDVAYLIAIVAPLAGIPLLAPGILVAVSPQLAVIGLGDKTSFTDPRTHYSSLVIAVLMAATVLGLARLPAKVRTLCAALALVLSSATAVLVGTPGGRHADAYRSLFTAREFEQRVDALREATSMVPAHASVSATNAAGSFLSARRFFYDVPIRDRAEWVIVEVEDSAMFVPPYGWFSPSRMRRFIAEMHADPRWQLVFSRSGVLVFQKAGKATR